jgi:hypothetical protein
MNIIIDLSNIMYNDLWMWNKTKLMEFCEGGDLFDYIQKRGPLVESSFQVSNSVQLLIIGLGKNVMLNQREKVKALCLTN